MKIKWTNLLVTVLMLVASAAQAELYKWVDADGVVHYTDRRPADDVQQQDLSPQLKSLLSPRRAEFELPNESPYANFSITRPQLDEVVRNDQETLDIEVQIEPPLTEEHFLQIYLDGLEVGEKTKSTALTLQQLERGTHRLQAVILDAEGQVIGRTEEVTFQFREATDLRQIAPNLVPPVAGN